MRFLTAVILIILTSIVFDACSSTVETTTVTPGIGLPFTRTYSRFVLQYANLPVFYRVDMSDFSHGNVIRTYRSDSGLTRDSFLDSALTGPNSFGKNGDTVRVADSGAQSGRPVTVVRYTVDSVHQRLIFFSYSYRSSCTFNCYDCTTQISLQNVAYKKDALGVFTVDLAGHSLDSAIQSYSRVIAGGNTNLGQGTCSTTQYEIHGALGDTSMMSLRFIP